MSSVRFLQRCLDAGMALDVAMLAAGAFEDEVAVMFPGPQTGAQRQQTYRAKKAVTKVTKSDEERHLRHERHAEKPSLTLSPKTPPFSPPKGGQFPPSCPTNDQADELWALQPAKFRRSTRPDVRRALPVALKLGSFEEIRAACRAYYAQSDKREAEGKFAKGAVWLLQVERWRDFLPSLEPPAAPPTAEALAGYVRHYRDTGEWRPAWGEKPKEIAA